jgi:raffinose/stachyose/melibiose transport system permease protein
MSYRLQRKIVICTFLFIPVSLLLLFLVYPVIMLFQLSFTNWTGLDIPKQYIGLQNYVKLFSSAEVWGTLKNNLVYFIVHVLVIPLEVIVAVFLNEKIRGNPFFRSITFMPYILNGVAIALIFSYLYNPINGPINEVFKVLGMESWIQRWLSDPKIVNYSLVVISLWKFCGFHIILFLAGLQSIPRDLYEAAKIDGANALQQIWNISVPGIVLVIDLVLFLNVRGALQVFDIPFLVTGGGPGIASSTFTVYTLNTAFKYNDYGLASTMAIILMVLIIIVSLIQKQLARRIGGSER